MSALITLCATSDQRPAFASVESDSLEILIINQGLTGSTLNDHEVWIGQADRQGAFNAEIGFIEVWAGALPGGVGAAEYGQSRWNGGNPNRVPEPATMALCFRMHNANLFSSLLDSAIPVQ